jgi:hypothetical protein
MPQPFARNPDLSDPKKEKDYNKYFIGSPLDKVRAVRDVLLDLPRLIDLPANRPSAAPAVVAGEK